MGDFPIIFSGAMIHALLAGRKTQTRRLASSPLRRAAPGDRLWVRETWRLDDFAEQEAIYRVNPDWPKEVQDSADVVRWRPSIHMPRWASRLTLKVTEVRRQRLIDITNADAIAEGLVEARQPDGDGYRHFSAPGLSDRHWPTPRSAFADLWERLHGPKSWNGGAEVVAITFTVTQRNIDHAG